MGVTQTNWEPLLLALAQLEHSPEQSAQAMTHWFYDMGSLTQKLRQCCQEFSVEVLQEYQPLSVMTDKKIHYRVSILHCDHQPWVLAVSQLSLTHLPENLQALTALGARPIGDVLFTDPLVKRSSFKVNKIFAPSFVHCDQKLWVRQSDFSKHEKIFLTISEIFLPAHPLYQS